MKFLKGINQDVGQIDQPENTYRDALNMLHGKRKGAMSTEEGNTLRGTIPDGYTIIGHTLIYDGTFVVFLAGKIGTAREGDSEIGTFDGNTYNQVIFDNAFNFDPDSTLEAVSIINNKEETVVYWTDNINPPRYYNITKNEGFDDIIETRLFPSVNEIPTIDLNRVQDSGGSIVTGTYHFTVRLIDEDGSTTSFMAATPPIYVNDETDVSAHDAYDGAPAGTATNKAISFTVDNLDQSYDRFEIAVIRKENNTIAEVNLLPQQTITGETSPYTYTSDEGETPSSIGEVLVNTASYATAKTIIETDNTLYLGNLSSQEDIGFQPFANNITVKSVLKNAEDGGSGLFDRDHYGNASISFYDKSFKRGEVYAFYISFLLADGSETPAYHIPGRESEGTEKGLVTDQTILDIDGVTGTENYNYEFFSNAGTNGMAYWENKNETYPSLSEDDDDNWKIMDVDANGDPVDTGNTLHDQPVRHHHFPDNSNSGFEFYRGRDNTDYGQALGVRFEDIKIPSDVIGRIKGVKIYYAKRTEGNKRILDQGFLRAGVPRPISNIDGNPTAWVPIKGDNNNAGDGFDFVTYNGFNAIRSRTNLGVISYIKSVNKTVGDSQSGTGGDDDDVFYDQRDDYQDIPSGDRFRAIKDGTAKTYLEEDSYMGDTGSGFSFDIDNRQGEESIAFELERALDMDMSTAIDTTDVSVGHLAEICAVREDMFNPFDLQELIWTGFTETDISKFDPRLQGTGEDVYAEGSIEVTSGSADLLQSATCVTTITSGAGSGGGDIEITYDGNTVITTTAANDDIDTVGAAIANDINADGSITLSCSFDSGTDELTFTADTQGTDENGKTVSINPTDSEVTFSDESPDMTGGNEPDDIVINFGGETFTIDTPNNETAANIASLINDNINANSTDYSSILSTATVTITANNYGAEYNSIIDISFGNTTVTANIDNIDGGSSADPGDLFIISSIYGGDIFIAPHGFKRTVRDKAYAPGSGLTGDEIEGHYRHLIYYVCESQDNIKLRHEGEGFDVYYPKTGFVEVLNFEDEGADIYIGNPIHYNGDYSALAEIKTATPKLKIGDSILSFPTRIIRSLQGDTNIGADEGTRTFLENDFIDLTKKRGPLITLSVVNNIIIPHMQRAIMKTKGRQEMAVGDIRAFVGAGDIFAIDPDEIISTEEGFGGTQDPRTAISTPHGYFFVDRHAGKVYLVTDSPTPISDKGLHNFFHEELTSINQDRQLIATYDNKWDRILLTKKGNWTIAYYPEREAWGSFYSYNPDYYLPGLNTFYGLYDNELYEHNIGNKSSEFSGVNQPSYVEFVDNRAPTTTKHVMNIKFISEVEDPNTGENFYKETFDHFQIKNSYQDSGEQDIVYFTGVNGNARHVEGTWKINKFRDMLVNGSIDLNKPWYEQSHFIGKYTKVKLIYNNSDNKFLYLYDANVGVKESIR